MRLLFGLAQAAAGHNASTRHAAASTILSLGRGRVADRTYGTWEQTTAEAHLQHAAIPT